MKMAIENEQYLNKLQTRGGMKQSVDGFVEGSFKKEVIARYAPHSEKLLSQFLSILGEERYGELYQQYREHFNKKGKAHSAEKQKEIVLKILNYGIVLQPLKERRRDIEQRLKDDGILVAFKYILLHTKMLNTL